MSLASLDGAERGLPSPFSFLFWSLSGLPVSEFEPHPCCAYSFFFFSWATVRTGVPVSRTFLAGRPPGSGLFATFACAMSFSCCGTLPAGGLRAFFLWKMPFQFGGQGDLYDRLSFRILL